MKKHVFISLSLIAGLFLSIKAVEKKPNEMIKAIKAPDLKKVSGLLAHNTYSTEELKKFIIVAQGKKEWSTEKAEMLLKIIDFIRGKGDPSDTTPIGILPDTTPIEILLTVHKTFKISAQQSSDIWNALQAALKKAG